MRMKSEWCWGTDQVTAFDNIKAELASAPVLCAFDLNRKHRVSADACKSAVGAVLLQSNECGDWQPVEHAFRKLGESETCYAMIEKEALAITWACEKFDYYLVRRKFDIETDHKPLMSLLGEKNLSELPVRVQRFKLRLMRYSYDIFHTPGNKMYLTDSLSRPVEYCSSASSVGDDHSSPVEEHVDDFIAHSDIREEELLEALQFDLVTKQCKDLVVCNSWPPSKINLSGELAKLYSSRDMLTVCNSFIMYNSRFYIPYSLRATYLHRCHEGHQGINKCCERVRQLFWLPNVNDDIARYVSGCESCTKSARVRHQPWFESPLPGGGAWMEVGADVLEFDSNLYLILVDYYSKWIEAVSITSQTAEVVCMYVCSIFVT